MNAPHEAAMQRAAGDDSWIEAALNPASIAVIGASENPEKIGGRPIKYMLQHGFAGRLYPVNPTKSEVQGLTSYPDIESTPSVPDLALVCVPGMAALDAVERCARRGVKVAVVISSGFGETGEEGMQAQAKMIDVARRAGMRLVGPNTQGLVNFGNAAIASFATLIGEVPPQSGPVAVVSQSGAMSVVPWAFLRAQGIGVKHSHATGNECDLTVADFTLAVVRDPEVKVVLLYTESLKDPATLARAAREALERGVHIVALKAGVSKRGQAAASSHTGAIATEDHVIDAFFRQHGILRVADMRSLTLATKLYLQGWRPTGKRIAAISNSGACCVMAADSATRHGLDMQAFPQQLQTDLYGVLPAFASVANPIDLTAALLTDSSLFSRVLPVVAQHGAADAFFIGLPMSGKGYDVPQFARDARAFAAQTGAPTVAASPLAATRETFEREGVVTFEHDEDAMAAIGQFVAHGQLHADALRLHKIQPAAGKKPTLPTGSGFLSEAESLKILSEIGVPVVEHRLCVNAEEVERAAKAMSGKLAIKACSAKIPHKSELGLVALGVNGAAEAVQAYQALMARAAQQNVEPDGMIVARMAPAQREFIIGARYDEQFGAVVMIGDGGKYVEAMPDVVTLLYPFDAAYAMDRMQSLKVAGLFGGVRGEAPLPVSRIAEIARALGEWMAAMAGRVRSVDINPLMAGPGDSVVAVDALIELSD